MSKPGAPTAVQLQKQIESLRAQIAQQNASASESGVKPLSYQPTPQIDNSKISEIGELYNNRLDLPKNLRNEIMKKGYNYKWINFTKFQKDAVHRSQWVPYRPEISTVADMVFGKTPEGYVTRGDCVLAVRPLAIDAAHKARIKQLNNRLKDHQKNVENDMRELVRANPGVKSHIVGDDDKDD